jgi:hypothetical protein
LTACENEENATPFFWEFSLRGLQPKQNAKAVSYWFLRKMTNAQ